MDDGATPAGGLSQLRDAAYTGAPFQQSMDALLGAQIIDPSAKWHAYAAGALKPTFGGFGASLSNALGAYTDVQQKEAELRARYMPLVTQAMLQRQLQAAQLAKQQFELSKHFDDAATGALTGLLHKAGPITGQDVTSVLGGLVQRGIMPPEYAQNFYATLPKEDPKNPDALRDEIKKRAIGRLGGQEALTAITPKLEPVNAGGTTQFPNTNPNAPVPAGVVLGGGVSKTLAPGERYRVEKDAAGNSFIVDLQDNTKYFPGAAQTPPPAAGSTTGAGPAPGAATGVPPPPVVAPGSAGAPKNTTVTNKQFEEDTGKNVAKYAEDMGQSLEALRNVQLRLSEMKSLVKDFQPGATAEYRQKGAAWLKDLAVTMGLSPSQADQIGQYISKGDISSAQAFQKLAIQGTLDILKAANSRFTQAEFGVMTQNNPNIMLDPASLDKMMNFMTKQYLYKSAEQQEFDAFRQGGNDLAGWNKVWNDRARELGYIRPSEIKGASKTSGTKLEEHPVSPTKSGKTARLTPEGWVYE